MYHIFTSKDFIKIVNSTSRSRLLGTRIIDTISLLKQIVPGWDGILEH